MKIIRVLMGTIGCICIVWTAVFGSLFIDKKHEVLSKVEYKGIITLWHIDTFEGGEGSRKQFLLKTAREFEKDNQGILISVIDHTPTSVKEQINKGEFPDLISFGNGVEVNGLKELAISNRFSVGKVNDKQYSYPWCRGGYLLITKKDNKESLDKKEIEKLIVSQSEYTLPLTALSLEGIKAKEIKSFSPLDAYVEFVSEKEGVLLGTQRDIVRLKNRGIEFKIRPLTQFCDLYQNIGLLSTNKEKISACNGFINLLLSTKTQSRLKEISMFSIDYSVNFEKEELNAMQGVDIINSVSCFLDVNTIKNIQEYSLMAIKGDTEALNKIKKLLI